MKKKNGSSISGRYPDIILFTDRMRKQHGKITAVLLPLHQHLLQVRLGIF